MLIVNKGAFSKGFVLMVSFLAVFMFIMSPSFGGKTGLEFSDDFFNRLSKNSSDYFGQVKATADKMKGKTFTVTAPVKLPDPKVEPDQAKAQDKANRDAQAYAKALTAAGAQVDVKNNVMTVKGDLGAMMTFTLDKSIQAFKVVGDAEAQKPENADTRKMLNTLWKAYGSMIKPMQADKQLDEAKAVDQVMRKAIEPAYNFYGISGEPVSKNIGLLIGLLVFYVVYTMWYGYAIFFMFEGLGMSMKKGKAKKA